MLFSAALDRITIDLTATIAAAAVASIRAEIKRRCVSSAAIESATVDVDHELFYDALDETSQSEFRLATIDVSAIEACVELSNTSRRLCCELAFERFALDDNAKMPLLVMSGGPQFAFIIDEELNAIVEAKAEQMEIVIRSSTLVVIVEQVVALGWSLADDWRIQFGLRAADARISIFAFDAAAPLALVAASGLELTLSGANSPQPIAVSATMSAIDLHNDDELALRFVGSSTARLIVVVRM